MAIKTTLALVATAATSLVSAQLPIQRNCTFSAYTSTDCTGDPVPPTVPHFASCWVGALQSYLLSGPQCFEVTVEGFGDDECGYPYQNVESEAHPLFEAGCYTFTSNPQSAYWFFFS
ncbi:hypothetical protein F5Y03DRAFT_335954 [Xylaria venustula]|nr:hypothetical protein F5Y03DRAFT_335954 [Xylaria venustula]